ncbi:multicopper oxidase domain-containing protein [Mucilaginibacter sp. MD40]|uniref:multicopper oxidase domain-containing protein n=1 Tax=Mucilaginibacter sp. MD40 TaxID=2029590 RepID=UPI0013045BDB|nr:multicopper oxidase domain-containing protein [Mucilaginibacter sp. MD40]
MKNIITIIMIMLLGWGLSAYGQQKEMKMGDTTMPMKMPATKKPLVKNKKATSPDHLNQKKTSPMVIKEGTKQGMPATAASGMSGMKMKGKAVKKMPMKKKGNSAMPGMKMDKGKMQGMDMNGKKDAMPGMKMPDTGTKPMDMQKQGGMKMDMNKEGMMPGMNMSGMAKSGKDTIASTSSTLNDHFIHAGKRVTYNLYITDTVANYTGKPVKAMAINGHIPGPTLTFTEGDTAYIKVHNRMNTETSIHWHGVLVPNQYDGVPYLTTVPILPDSTHLFIIPLRQTGTFWYHSHTELDEQSGLYGSIVINPQIKKNDYPEQVMLFSDWTDYKPKEVQRMLKRGTDWFSIQKGSVLSYGGAISKGYLGDKLKLDWRRMPAMDLADVKYDRFLVNGYTDQQLSKFKPGQTVKLRIINGSSSSYFWLNYAGSQMTVIAADGLEVKPVTVDKILIGTAETYDVLVKIPLKGKYEFRATYQDVSGKVSAWLGSGAEVKAKDIPPVPYYKLTHTFNRMMGQMNMPMNAVPSSKVKNDGLEFSKSTGKMKMDGMDMGGMKMDGKENKPVPDKGDMKMAGMDMKGDSSMKMSGSKSKKMSMKGMNPDMADQQKDMGNMDMGGMGRMNMTDDGRGTKMGPGGSMLLGLGGEGKILTYDMLQANSSTAIEGTHTVRTYHLYLTGSMIRYTWLINNKALSEADKLLIKKGEIVRFVLHNTTMMEHPMHLHGHFFRVLNAKGDSAPLKHTVSIEPMQVKTIEFLADEAHDWFFHCHTLYHMMSGMARVVRYEDAPSNPQVAPYQKNNPLLKDDRQWYTWGMAAFHSQTSVGSVFISNTRYEFNANYRFSYDGRYEIDPRFQRYLDNNQYLAAYVGGNFEQTEKGRLFSRKGDNSAVVGLRYLLPLFVQTDARISSKGQFRLTVSREDIPLSTRLYMGASYNTDNEFQVDTRYILTKYFAVSASYDNQYGFGGGLTIIY